MSQQQVLTIEYGGETIVSKPFDFETMCLMDDAGGGMLRRGREAVSYLFEGTKATDTVLKSLPTEEQTELSMKVCKWFRQEMDNAAKNV